MRATCRRFQMLAERVPPTKTNHEEKNCLGKKAHLPRGALRAVSKRRRVARTPKKITDSQAFYQGERILSPALLAALVRLEGQCSRFS